MRRAKTESIDSPQELRLDELVLSTTRLISSLSSPLALYCLRFEQYRPASQRPTVRGWSLAATSGACSLMERPGHPSQQVGSVALQQCPGKSEPQQSHVVDFLMTLLVLVATTGGTRLVCIAVQAAPGSARESLA